MTFSFTFAINGEPGPDYQRLVDDLVAKGYVILEAKPYTWVRVERPLLPDGGLIVGAQGYDASRHNWPLNHAAAKAAGLTFVYLRASMGFPSSTFTGRDERYIEHRDNARAAGQLVGAYHLFIWDLDGATQANHFAQVTQRAWGDLPPVVDVEPRAQDTPDVVDKFRSTTNLSNFITRLQELTGEVTVIYTSRSAWQRMTTEPQWISAQKLFVADYTDPLELPAHATQVWARQHTVAPAGSLPWHPGALDLDVYLKDFTPAPPAPLHTLRDHTNQQVINLFYRAFTSYSQLTRAIPTWANSLAGVGTPNPMAVRAAAYTGPAIEAMSLTAAEQAALIAALG